MEGTLAFLPSNRQQQFKRFARKQDWHKAAEVWELNNLVMRQINRVSWQNNINIEIITFIAGIDFASAMESRLSGLNLSIATVSYYMNAQELSNQLPYELNILAVYDPDPWRSMSYGAKGRHLTSAHQLGV